MKKIVLFIIAMLLYASSVIAQTGLVMNRYYITGSLSLGKGGAVFADSSAWLDIGKDTTNRGLLMPHVLLDSINTSKTGLFVYDIVDSVLYHYDGTQRVRYMTYKDTALIKGIIANAINTLKTYGDSVYLPKYYGGVQKLELQADGLHVLPGASLHVPYYPYGDPASGELNFISAGEGYSPMLQTKVSKMQKGFVNNLDALEYYSGIENVVHYGSAVFVYVPGLSHAYSDHIRFWKNVGKNGVAGCWRLAGESTVFAEWFYQGGGDTAWFTAVQAAASLAGEGGTVVWPDNTVILQNRTLQTAPGQTHLMQGSTLKLLPPQHIFLAANADSGATVIKVVGAIPSHWGPYTPIALYFGPTWQQGSIVGTYIHHISADSIYLIYGIPKPPPGRASWLAGDMVTNPFGQIAEGDFPVYFEHGTIDGSKNEADSANFSYVHWSAVPHSQATFKDVQFKNIIGDVFLGHRIKAINCRFDSINGAILHTSGLAASAQGVEPNLLQNCDGRNIGLVSVDTSGHHEGKGAVVTHSASPGNYVIDNCRFYGANSKLDAPIGSFNSWPTDNILSPQDVHIRNSYFEGWNHLIYPYGGNGQFTGRYDSKSKIENIYFENNVFRDMGVNDYSEQSFFGDSSKIGVVIFAGNVCVGNTQIKLCDATAGNYFKVQLPIIVNGDTIKHSKSAVVPGNYNMVSVDSFGHVTSGSMASYLTGSGGAARIPQFTSSGTGLMNSPLYNVDNVYVGSTLPIIVSGFLASSYIQTSFLQVQTSSYRWEVGGKGEEIGGNTGTNFVWDAFDDAGTYIGRHLTINRASGIAYFANALRTGTPSISSAAGLFKIGQIVLGTNGIDKYLEVEIDGQTGYIPFFNTKP